jgi:hypothetical protein
MIHTPSDNKDLDQLFGSRWFKNQIMTHSGQPLVYQQSFRPSPFGQPPWLEYVNNQMPHTPQYLLYTSSTWKDNSMHPNQALTVVTRQWMFNSDKHSTVIQINNDDVRLSGHQRPRLVIKTVSISMCSIHVTTVTPSLWTILHPALQHICINTRLYMITHPGMPQTADLEWFIHTIQVFDPGASGPLMRGRLPVYKEVKRSQVNTTKWGCVNIKTSDMICCVACTGNHSISCVCVCL